LRILLGEHWKDGYLDYACGPESLRIKPLRWLCVDEVRSQYFELPRSFRLVWNYVREVGIGATLRKIRSRSAEAAHRNKKLLSVGAGVVVEVGANVSAHSEGDVVGFVATNHPECVERVVVHESLVRPVETLKNGGELRWLGLGNVATKHAEKLIQLGGWSDLSGNALPENKDEYLQTAAAALAAADWGKARKLAVGDAATVHQPAVRPTAAGNRKSAVLYGYGNYAKTMCLPNVSAYVDVQAVHEIDPAQMPHPLPDEFAWDSRYWPADDTNYDVYLIASYHHTHAGIAEYALRKGAYAVVEKPIVTTFDQLESLGAALQTSEAGLYSGFHKRYASYNDWVFEDLEAEPGSPISMHSIVFEMPLPRLHWYRWKNSCGRVVANGCHWIDHFLFMNSFAPVAKIDVSVAHDETINATVALENGALFTMVLTDQGSRRLGVQNNVEFRNENGTVRIINDGGYFAESHDRIKRRRDINRLETYSRMYQTIARRISEGERGDTLDSFQTSAGLILEIERRVQEQLTAFGATQNRNLG
jgi:predicted dehydrogenase